MLRIMRALTIISFVAMLTASVQAINLNGRSRIEIHGGFAGGSENSTVISGTNVEVSTGAGGAMGGIMFGHWLQENLAVTIRVSAITNDIDKRVGIGTVSTYSSTITAIHPGMQYNFLKSSMESSWRPYVSVSVGPYIGHESSTNITTSVTVESSTQTAFGAQLGAGVNIQLSRLFMLGMHTGYNLMSNFSEPIGGKENYSNGEFSIGLSLLLGSGK